MLGYPVSGMWNDNPNGPHFVGHEITKDLASLGDGRAQVARKRAAKGEGGPLFSTDELCVESLL